MSAPASETAVADAIRVMDQLWRFDGWEATQTHDSLRPYLLEETYELLDAFTHGDPATIREELGDLLLQVLFHARIAEAAGEFTIAEVAQTLVDKLRHRSPHLAEDTHRDATRSDKIAAQEKAWQERKSSEKARRSCLDGIARAQPALALAEKVRTRAATAGLPDELVPPDLHTVRLGEASSAEDRLREATLRWMTQIRAAEDAAATARDHRTPLTPEDWRSYWPQATRPTELPDRD